MERVAESDDSLTNERKVLEIETSKTFVMGLIYKSWKISSTIRLNSKKYPLKKIWTL